jgi:hypothetical protein
MVMRHRARFPTGPTNERLAPSNYGEQFLASFKIAENCAIRAVEATTHLPNQVGNESKIDQLRHSDFEAQWSLQ